MTFDRDLYRSRNLVERLKHFRRVATRYEKRSANDLAMVTRRRWDPRRPAAVNPADGEGESEG